MTSALDLPLAELPTEAVGAVLGADEDEGEVALVAELLDQGVHLVATLGGDEAMHDACRWSSLAAARSWRAGEVV